MKNSVLALVLSVVAHATLAVALVITCRMAPEPDTLATLDLSSVELSFAEKEDETAAVRPVAASAPQPPPPPPEVKDEPPPPPPDAEKIPLPPDASAPKFPEPVESVPRLETPPRPVQEPKKPEVPPKKIEEPPKETEEPPPKKAEPPKPAPAPAAAPAPAVAPRQAKVDAPPRPKRTIRPVYPKGARQRGEQGEVALEIAVTAEGKVSEAHVIGSCGFAELDDAAVAAVRDARFVPARSGGRPVASVARLKIAFRLK